MADRYIALAEETTFGSAGSSFKYFKLLRESIETRRTDFFPETTEHWTVPVKAEGYFSTSGDFDTVVEPVVWPWLLVYFIGDPSTSQPDSVNAPNTYQHVFKFGADETVSSTGIKPFTIKIGTGIERDRQIVGNVIETLTIEAVNRELVASTVSIIGSGHETLVTADTPDWSAYTHPPLAFTSLSTFTIGGTDRLTTQPTVEAFRLSLGRSWDADHYVLGNRYWAYPILSGYATVEGSIDLTWRSQDEYERFLSSVGATETGDQSSFAIDLILRGNLIEESYYYQIEVTIPKAYYTSSTANITGRDRIVQTVNFRGIYDSSEACACKIIVQNSTASY